MATNGSRDRDIAIVGVAESDVMGTTPNKSSLQHHGEAAYNALEDAGLSKNDVDGVLTAGFSTLATAEYLGIHPGFTDNTSVGGSSFVIHVAHAMAAIRAGYCEVALITHGEAGRSRRAPVPPDPNLPMAQYEAPYGMLGRPSTTRWPAPATCTNTARKRPGRAWRRLPSLPESGPTSTPKP